MQAELKALHIRIDGIHWNPDPATLHSPELQRLWAFWREEHRNDSPTPVQRLDIDSRLPPELRPYCILVIPTAPDYRDFRYRYYGSAVVGEVGKDWTGQCLSRMIRTGTAGLFYLASYRAALKMNQPALTINISAPRLNTVFWHRLVLPWYEAGKITGFLVGDIPGKSAAGRITAYPDIHLEENAYLYSLLAESPLGVGIFVREEEFVFCNPALAQILGTTTTVLERRHPAQLFQNPDLFQQHLHELHQGEPVAQREAALRTAGGELVWAVVSYKRILFGGLDSVLMWVVDITARRQLEENLRRLATIDDLTGISNRRHFLEQTRQELERVRRYGHSCTVAVIDVDHFKTINDRHGHAGGDLALQTIATTMARSLRQGDLLGRLGGEEFGILLSHADPGEAKEVLERLRQHIEALRIDHRDDTIRLTISAGLAACHSADGLESALLGADQALYEAKARGRNRVWVQHRGRTRFSGHPV